MIHGFNRIFATHTWIVWGYVLLMLITLGGLSCVRPACDIFLAGVTQSIPVFYLQYCLYVTTFCHHTLSRVTFGLLFIGVILNAPLIVLYPHLLDMFGAPITNVCLHATLLLSWGSQGVGYYAALSELPELFPPQIQTSSSVPLSSSSSCAAASSSCVTEQQNTHKKFV
mgnify:FL=1